MSKKTKTRVRPVTCQFPFADGRHCKMPVAASHPYLCLFHADRERRLADQAHCDSARDAVLAELSSLSGEIKTVSDLNHLLTRLWSLVAARRLDRFTASHLAYIASLLRQTLPGVKAEICKVHGYDEWERALARAFAPRRPADSGHAPTS